MRETKAVALFDRIHDLFDDLIFAGTVINFQRGFEGDAQVHIFFLEQQAFLVEGPAKTVDHNRNHNMLLLQDHLGNTASSFCIGLGGSLRKSLHPSKVQGLVDFLHFGNIHPAMNMLTGFSPGTFDRDGPRQTE